MSPKQNLTLVMDLMLFLVIKYLSHGQ